MIKDIKRMDLYRIVVDCADRNAIATAIKDVLNLEPSSETSDGNIEVLPIDNQVQCIFETHGGVWPDTHPIYFHKRFGKRVKMEIVWFRFVESVKKNERTK